MTQLFLENNDERVRELAKLSGKDRENYLIKLVNDLTKDRNYWREKIQDNIEKFNDNFNFE